MNRPISQRLAGPAIVVFAALLATAPQLLRGNTCGHDFDFHLVSWFDCFTAWRHGFLYPHWAPSPNYGAGEPRFLFYPPLTWMLGASLAFVLPWPLVPIALTFLLLAATGLATRALGRLILSPAPATLAGCTAIFSGYALFTAYERSAFAELAGGLWIPLLLLCALRPTSSTRQILNRSTAFLALTVAGAWLSNAPVGVMASYLLAAVALTSAVLYRSWTPILRAALAAALGLALTAFYLLPAAYEQRWVDIRQATEDPGEAIENSFLFGHHAEPLLHIHNVELQRVSILGLSMIVVALIGLAIALRRKSLPADRRLWIPLALIPIAVLFLLLPISLPVWNLLPKLRFLQFPWRWLVVCEAPMAIFFAAAVWPRITASRVARIAIPAVCGLLFLTATGIAAKNFFQPCDNEDAVLPMLEADRNGTGFQGTDEYAPIDADNSLVADGLPDACLVTEPDTVLGLSAAEGENPNWQPEQHTCDAVLQATTTPEKGDLPHYRLHASLPHAGYLILHLRAYPAWRITLNSHLAGPLNHREDGLIEFAVPQGLLDVAADWTTTSDVKAGRAISAAALILLLALAFVKDRKRVYHA